MLRRPLVLGSEIEHHSPTLLLWGSWTRRTRNDEELLRNWDILIYYFVIFLEYFDENHLLEYININTTVFSRLLYVETHHQRGVPITNCTQINHLWWKKTYCIIRDLKSFSKNFHWRMILDKMVVFELVMVFSIKKWALCHESSPFYSKWLFFGHK